MVATLHAPTVTANDATLFLFSVRVDPDGFLENRIYRLVFRREGTAWRVLEAVMVGAS